jgi:hypothetical protein
MARTLAFQQEKFTTISMNISSSREFLGRHDYRSYTSELTINVRSTCTNRLHSGIRQDNGPVENENTRLIVLLIFKRTEFYQLGSTVSHDRIE